MTRSVYLAGPYASRATLAQYAAELTQIGYVVTATWLEGKHEPNYAGPIKAEDAQRWSRLDLKDIDRADVLVAFTAVAAGTPDDGKSGGRHVETGYAIAHKKRVVVVGHVENIFQTLGTCVADWHAAVLLLSRELVEHERDMPRDASEVRAS